MFIIERALINTIGKGEIMLQNPEKIAKAKTGEIVKVYRDGSDWAIITSGKVKYPTLYKTAGEQITAGIAALCALDYNGLELLEFIK